MKFFFRPTKEMGLILIIAFLPIFVFGIIAVNRSVEVAQRAVEKADRMVAANLADQTQLYLIRAEAIIKSLAGLSLSDLNENTLEAVYENNGSQGTLIFESLIVLDEEGILRIIYPPREELIGLDYSRQTFFDSVKREENVFFSRVKFSSLNQEPVIGIAAPIFKRETEGRLVGVIQGSIRLQGLSSLLKEVGIAGARGEAFLVNQFGDIIAHPDYRLVREQENISNINPKLSKKLLEISKEKAAFRYSSPQGVDYLVSFQTIPRTGWKLIIKREMAEASAIPAKLRQFLLIILFLTILGAGIISYRVASYIVQLRTAWEKIRERRLKELEEVKTALEIIVRARTNQLREQAETLRRENEKKTRELRERMKELERFHRLAVGRELKMAELKEKIKKKEARLRDVTLKLKNYVKKSKEKPNTKEAD